MTQKSHPEFNDPRAARLRARMVKEQLVPRGIDDRRVLDAMTDLPREHFMDEGTLEDAYADNAARIGEGQTISQPYMVALMTQELRVEPDCRILEIGTGSGYQTAVLARIASWVHSIERLAPLSRRAEQRLAALGIDNVTLRVGDGTEGWPDGGRFERIIVTAGAPEIPRALIDQLADGGRMVIPVGRSRDQTLLAVSRSGPGITQTPLIPCRFVKLVGSDGW